MSIAYWCLLLAMIFPYVFCVLAKSVPRFDHNNPRENLERLKGWRKRANWVQLNSFEILPSFAAAVIIAHQYVAFHPILDLLAIGFILMRILYAICYIADKALLRTVCWVLSFGFVLVIFLFSTMHYSNYGMGFSNKGKQSEFCHDGMSKQDGKSKYKKNRGMHRQGEHGKDMPNHGEPGKMIPNHGEQVKPMPSPGATNHGVVNPGAQGAAYHGAPHEAANPSNPNHTRDQRHPKAANQNPETANQQSR